MECDLFEVIYFNNSHLLRAFELVECKLTKRKKRKFDSKLSTGRQ